LDVPLLVDLRELAERQRRHLARRLDASLVECAITNRALQIVERRVCCCLVVDLTIRPFHCSRFLIVSVQTVEDFLIGM
jgi:hypothetical protein